MGEVVRFSRRHARASASSTGYRSGRNSWRGMPEAASTASTRSGGTSVHCETACAVTPISLASSACPPTRSFARSKGDLSSMERNSSIALPISQATLHCRAKEALYNVEMTMGKRIQAARRRITPKLTQRALATALGVSDKAVSGWERDEASPEYSKMPDLRRILRVTYAWLMEGGDAPPPSVDDPEVLIEDRMVNLFRRERPGSAA